MLQKCGEGKVNKLSRANIRGLIGAYYSTFHTCTLPHQGLRPTTEDAVAIWKLIGPESRLKEQLLASLRPAIPSAKSQPFTATSSL